MSTWLIHSVGKVRQYGNFSFSRIYEAGHEVPAFQPEASYEVFRRVMSNLDIATGQLDTATNTTYSTTGPASSFDTKNDLPAEPEPTCYVLSESSCTSEQWEGVLSGSTPVKDYILLDGSGKDLFNGLSEANATNGDASGSDSGLGGQYVGGTATSTSGPNGGTSTTSGGSSSPTRGAAGTTVVNYWTILMLSGFSCIILPLL